MLDPNIESLTHFGLTVTQSKVYLSLLQLGTSKASQLCSTTGLVRPEVYRILRELSNKGLVQRNLSSPSSFTATPPTRAIPLLVRRFRERLANLESAQRALTKSLSTLRAPLGNEPTSEHLSVITGSSNLILKSSQLLADAKRDYAGIISKLGLERMRELGMAQSLISASRRRLRIRLISEIDNSNKKSADLISRYVELRRSRDLQFYMEIMDKKEMLIGPAFTNDEIENPQKRESKIDLWTSNPRFIAGMYALFERLWEASPKYPARK